MREVENPAAPAATASLTSADMAARSSAVQSFWRTARSPIT